MTAAHRGRLLDFSPRESARFGLRIYRGATTAVDVGALLDEIERDRVDVAIVRVPAESVGLAAALARVGLPAIAADTLMHYSVDLRDRSFARPTVGLLRIGQGERDLLESTVRAVFEGYASHYHANPLFDPARILDGYVEWALRHVASGGGQAAYGVESENRIVGFSCLRIGPDVTEAAGVLNGILPAQRRRGFYRAMLQATLAHVAAQGATRFRIATHAHNVAVQRTWISEGFMLERAESTVHVNALRSHGRA